MKLRLAKCCYFVNLRSGCFLVAFFDMCMHMVHLSYGKIPQIQRSKPWRPSFIWPTFWALSCYSSAPQSKCRRCCWFIWQRTL
ncbi:uncharacterized protein LOC115767540 isoform X2 [Drosophila novamexicana]|uniref:uncharacterized protein LOC115764344 isoform X2 n=1 Tax=Drosophila novamexicana TaxID=47314 RepID=UPI0011E58AD4|nr:uncharacterized protein LOC115764344 isoform X2 [Drosophila novamexicana]XP_030567679.1 uncharacterized protein LOC115767540 isoform X2 [Drosophila novamexicana]